jgi:hypothetical protein
VRPITVRRRGTAFRCALDALRAPGKTAGDRLAILAARSVTDAPPKLCGDLFGGRVKCPKAQQVVSNGAQNTDRVSPPLRLHAAQETHFACRYEAR